MISGIPELKLQFLLSEMGMTIDIQLKIRYAVNYAWFPSSQRASEVKSTNFCCDEVRKVVQQYGLEIY